jgi:hypothetical protein
VFPPGTRLDEIVDWVRERLAPREEAADA